MTTKQIIQNLEATVGQEGFAGAAHQAEQLSRIELLALVKEFTGWRVTSRKAAIRKLWSRHNQFVVVAAKRRATAGRVAA